MNGLFKFIPPFAPDQSGATAVLFSLGGIVVICDAGGCAGNICGFDEPRWFTEKSAVFSAALRDIDAILGRDERLVQKLEEATAYIDAKFAAIIGTPVPAVIGTDFRALRRMAERRLGLPVVAIDTTGIGFYDEGESKAYISLLSAFAGEKCSHSFDVGVFGATPLNLPYKGYEEELKSQLEEKYGTVSMFTGENGIEDLKNAAAAKLNIAVSTSGIKACEYLKQRFGTDYRVEFPTKKFGKSITNDVLRMTYGEKQKAVKNEELLRAPGCWQKEKKPFSAGCGFCSSAESSGFNGFDFTEVRNERQAEWRSATIGEGKYERPAKYGEPSAKDTGSCADSDESRRKTDNYLRGTRCEARGARCEVRKANNELLSAISHQPSANAPTLIIHQQVLANSVRAALEEQGETADVATWFTLNRNYAHEGDLQLREEDEFFALLRERKYTKIVADPIFRRCLADFDGEFIPICHYACSGELFAGQAADSWQQLISFLRGKQNEKA